MKKVIKNKSAGVGGISTIGPATESSTPVAPPEAISALPEDTINKPQDIYSKKPGLSFQPSSEMPAWVTEDSLTRNLPQQEIDYKGLSKPIITIPQEEGIVKGKFEPSIPKTGETASLPIRHPGVESPSSQSAGGGLSALQSTKLNIPQEKGIVKENGKGAKRIQ